MNTVNSQNRIIQRLKEFGNANYQQRNRRGTGTLYPACDERRNGALCKIRKEQPEFTEIEAFDTAAENQ